MSHTHLVPSASLHRKPSSSLGDQNSPTSPLPLRGQTDLLDDDEDEDDEVEKEAGAHEDEFTGFRKGGYGLVRRVVWGVVRGGYRVVQGGWCGG